MAAAAKNGMTDTTNGRDERGRFATGNMGGPGNPFSRQVAALRKALLDVVSEEDMRKIAHMLVVQAQHRAAICRRPSFC
jgi:hypothetical protein